MNGSAALLPFAMSEVDALTSRLAQLQRQRSDLLAEEEHVSFQLVRTLRQELMIAKRELEETKAQLMQAHEHLELLAPVQEGLRRLRREDSGEYVAVKVVPSRLLEAAITFGRSPPEDVVQVIGAVPAVRLAHALMETVAERLASRRIADGVRHEMSSVHYLSSSPRGEAAEDDAGDDADPLQAPSVDVVGALLEHAGGWRGACALAGLNRSWRDAVTGWRRYERTVSLATSGGADGSRSIRTGFAALRAVAKQCPHLTDLEVLGRRDAAVHDVGEVNDVACELFVGSCAAVRRLVLRDCAALSCDALSSLATLDALEELDLAGCDGILDAGGGEGATTISRSAQLCAFARARPQLRKLVLYGCTPLAVADEEQLLEAGLLERASCGCNRCVGIASAQLRLRLALMGAMAMGTEGALG